MDEEIQIKHNVIGMKECPLCGVLTFWNASVDKAPEVCRVCNQPFEEPK